MECRKVLHELDAYLTGELDRETGARVGRHLEECAACRNELELLRKENAIYREYGGAMDISDASPAPGFKPESGIHWWRWAAAAAVLVAAFLSWNFHLIRIGDQPAVSGQNGQMKAIPASVNQAMSGYEQAVFMLKTSYEGKKKNLDPALVRILDRNLEIAEAAIAECRLALELYPNHPQAIEFLLLNYEKQLGMLKQITEAL